MTSTAKISNKLAVVGLVKLWLPRNTRHADRLIKCIRRSWRPVLLDTSTEEISFWTDFPPPKSQQTSPSNPISHPQQTYCFKNLKILSTRQLPHLSAPKCSISYLEKLCRKHLVWQMRRIFLGVVWHLLHERRLLVYLVSNNVI